MTIKVSNFDLQLTDEALKEVFKPYGEVKSARIAMDSFTGRSRGFGLVEMANEDEGRQAIAALNNSKLGAFTITATETEPEAEHRGSYKVGTGSIQPYRFKKG